MNILFLGYGRDETKLIEFLEADGHQVTRLGPQAGVHPESKLVKEADMIISYGYCKILKKAHIDAVDGKIINLHVSYPPWIVTGKQHQCVLSSKSCNSHMR